MTFSRAVMALICGVMSNFPCPICLIPREEISKFPNLYPLHTSDNVAATSEKARSQQLAEEKERILAAEGLRDVDVSYVGYSHSFALMKFSECISDRFQHKCPLRFVNGQTTYEQCRKVWPPSVAWTPEDPWTHGTKQNGKSQRQVSLSSACQISHIS